jgi:DNA-binding MarR family transcriptional regulator
MGAVTGTTGQTAQARTDAEAVVDGLLSVSRVMVGLTARTLNDLNADVSLPQYRMLIVLASRGPQRTADLALELAVQPSTVTRKVDRLIGKGLVWRRQRPQDRRVSWLGLTEAGKELVGITMRRRREAIAKLVAGMDIPHPGIVAATLTALTVAAGEVPDPQWWDMWATSVSDEDA